jgi:hypothetical protein
MLRGRAGKSKQRCQNCSTKNSRVRDYRYVDAKGLFIDQKMLCEECDGIMRRLLVKEAQSKAA